MCAIIGLHIAEKTCTCLARVLNNLAKVNLYRSTLTQRKVVIPNLRIESCYHIE